MHKNLAITASLAIFLTSTPQVFAFNKCTQTDGKIIFTDRPCDASSKAERIGIKANASTGTIPSQWRNGYCKAKFTRDFTIDDPFAGVQLNIHKGDEYLLHDVDSLDVDILLFGKQGAVELSFKNNKTDNPFSTTPKCENVFMLDQDSVQHPVRLFNRPLLSPTDGQSRS